MVDRAELGVPEIKTDPRIDIVAYGQNAEDAVLMRVFRGAVEGVYVDAGAGHPTKGSLTKNLHDILGFRGVEIEPIARHADALSRERKNGRVFNVGVGSVNGLADFFECDNWAMSTFDEATMQRHKKMGTVFDTREHPVRKLDVILEQSGFVQPGFELLKLDVEGAETDVLLGFDLEKWRPKVIVAETTNPGSMTRRETTLGAILGKHGYFEVLFDGINSFYLHCESPELLDKLSVAANKNDYHIPLVWWQQLSDQQQQKYPHLQPTTSGGQNHPHRRTIRTFLRKRCWAWVWWDATCSRHYDYDDACARCRSGHWTIANSPRAFGMKRNRRRGRRR